MQKYDSISKYNSHRMFVNICNYIKSHRSLTGQHCTWQLFQVIFRLFSGSSLKVLSFSKSFTIRASWRSFNIIHDFLFWINSIPESQISSTGFSVCKMNFRILQACQLMCETFGSKPLCIWQHASAIRPWFRVGAARGLLTWNWWSKWILKLWDKGRKRYSNS